MPRVQMKKKANAGHKVYTCTGCGKPIEPGQEYYTWKRRMGRGGYRYYRHVACGRPRPTELSSAKTAVIEEAVQDADLSAWQPSAVEDPDQYEADLGDLGAVLEEVAGVAREVADEYESGVSNMPDSLQYSPTAEAMNQTAEELNSWADTLEGFVDNVSDPELPERNDGEGDDEYLARCQEAVDDWADGVRNDAQGELDNMPYYQG